MGKVTKRQYTLEFKQQAVELAKRIGCKRTADQLGVNVANIQRWKSKVNAEGKTVSAAVSQEEENRRLRKENEELRKVNQILKRAAAFFSQDHLK